MSEITWAYAFMMVGGLIALGLILNGWPTLINIQNNYYDEKKRGDENG